MGAMMAAEAAEMLAARGDMLDDQTLTPRARSSTGLRTQGGQGAPAPWHHNSMELPPASR
jgi:hypothetical protein